MQPAIRLRVAHLRGPHSGPKGRTYYIYIYTDSEIIVLTRWGSLGLAPITDMRTKEVSKCTVASELSVFS